MRLRAGLVVLPAVVGLVAAADVGQRPAPRTTVTRHFTPADRVAGRYQYVPFDVPAGTGSLTIRYAYDRADGDNVVDLGLFEPGPLELGTPAFRGYSGGARSSVTIGRATTTPGYRPGPLPPGRWHVLLGLYKVRPAGVEVTIEIDAERGPPPPPPLPPRARRNAEAAAGAAGGEGPPGRWFMGALHTHTTHSDGTVDPLELIRLSRDAGFDFVAITDHNNTTHRHDLAPRLAGAGPPLWIVGEEVTTPGGHASVWGLEGGGWVDFRVSAAEGRIAALVAAAHAQGALFSINHPVSTCDGCGWTHDVVDGIDGIEIANGQHGEVDRALAFWDALLTKGRRLTAVGSSDWHRPPNPIDVANARVFASSLTRAPILDGIRQGRVIVMRSARDATPAIVVRSGARKATIGEALAVDSGRPLTIDVSAPGISGGRVVVVTNGEAAPPVALDPQGRARLQRPAAHGYMRFEVRATDGAPIALTNPVYVVRP